jgi:hypothetical protein
MCVGFLDQTTTVPSLLSAMLVWALAAIATTSLNTKPEIFTTQSDTFF